MLTFQSLFVFILLDRPTPISICLYNFIIYHKHTHLWRCSAGLEVNFLGFVFRFFWPILVRVCERERLYGKVHALTGGQRKLGRTSEGSLEEELEQNEVRRGDEVRELH